ncbi:hypothetical protein [Nonomuraea sp. NPDC049784]|uniref:hypothetical protein n=1 Tax=Nonomuraea sp. NPDC049784 TaxID=3154361 RepID=UPI0033EE4842
MWTPALAALVTDLFKEMAPAWDAEHATGRLDFLTDALDRGGPLPNGICLELGAGTGQPAPRRPGTCPSRVRRGWRPQRCPG